MGLSTRRKGDDMMGFLIRAAISALGLWVASHLLAGLSFDTPTKLLIAALVLGVVNALVRPIAFILTLPITILTLGLFLLVLNAAMIGLVAWLVPGFQVSGFWTALGAGLIVSLVSWAASSLIGSSGKLEVFNARR
jgi:putative membrane protein